MESDERNVSGRPGAEGAPRGRLSLLPLEEEENLDVAVLVVDEACDDAGAIRRDCDMSRPLY